MSKIQADCETVTETNLGSGMSVKMTHINHAYKHNQNANLMHQKTALTSLHLSETPATLCMKQN